jgi:hypothetical protein
MEMDDDKFKSGAVWVGGILAAIVAEAVLLQLARRCFPRLFPVQQQVPPTRK